MGDKIPIKKVLRRAVLTTVTSPATNPAFIAIQIVNQFNNPKRKAEDEKSDEDVFTFQNLTADKIDAFERANSLLTAVRKDEQSTFKKDMLASIEQIMKNIIAALQTLRMDMNQSTFDSVLKTAELELDKLEKDHTAWLVVHPWKPTKRDFLYSRPKETIPMNTLLCVTTAHEYINKHETDEGKPRHYTRRTKISPATGANLPNVERFVDKGITTFYTIADVREGEPLEYIDGVKLNRESNGEADEVFFTVTTDQTEVDTKPGCQAIVCMWKFKTKIPYSKKKHFSKLKNHENEELWNLREEHEKRWHGDALTCTMCREEFTSLVDLMAHRFQTHIVYCHKCLFRQEMGTEENIVTHMAKMHPDAATEFDAFRTTIIEPITSAEARRRFEDSKRAVPRLTPAQWIQFSRWRGEQGVLELSLDEKITCFLAETRPDDSISKFSTLPPEQYNHFMTWSAAQSVHEPIRSLIARFHALNGGKN